MITSDDKIRMVNSISFDEIVSIFGISNWLSIREDESYFYVNIENRISRNDKRSIKEKLGLHLEICNEIEDVFGTFTRFIIKKIV